MLSVKPTSTLNDSLTVKVSGQVEGYTPISGETSVASLFELINHSTVRPYHSHLQLVLQKSKSEYILATMCRGHSTLCD